MSKIMDSSVNDLGQNAVNLVAEKEKIRIMAQRKRLEPKNDSNAAGILDELNTKRFKDEQQSIKYLDLINENFEKFRFNQDLLFQRVAFELNQENNIQGSLRYLEISKQNAIDFYKNNQQRFYVAEDPDSLSFDYFSDKLQPKSTSVGKAAEQSGNHNRSKEKLLKAQNKKPFANLSKVNDLPTKNFQKFPTTNKFADKAQRSSEDAIKASQHYKNFRKLTDEENKIHKTSRGNLKLQALISAGSKISGIPTLSSPQKEKIMINNQERFSGSLPVAAQAISKARPKAQSPPIPKSIITKVQSIKAIKPTRFLKPVERSSTDLPSFV